jgi:hypothetical protein
VLDRALAALAVLPFLLGAAAAPSDHARVAFELQDARITESSGLVALGGGRFVTTNDSGDTGRVFTLDEHGRTIGVTTWAGQDGESATDVEALAPAGDDAVWVGDTGDNRASRDSVQLTRVPVGNGDRESDNPVYDLVYPDGAHDAETLLAGPDGRLYLVTKGFLGGTVYAAPATLDPTRPNRLRQVGPTGAILPMATDGAFLPDGDHVLVRGYASAAVYAFPSLDRVDSLPLPSQQQGEGLAVAPDGTVLLSSEGVRAPVLALPPVTIPATGAAAAGPTGAPTPTPTPSTTRDASERERAVEETHRSWWPWALGGVVGALAVGVLLRSLRPR